MDMSTWTETDVRDVSWYGVCECGRPRRAYTELGEDDRPTYLSMRCDAGHEPGYDGRASVPPTPFTTDHS